MSQRCKAIKENGLKCKNVAVDDSELCSSHLKMSKKRKGDDTNPVMDNGDVEDIIEDFRTRIEKLESCINTLSLGVKKERKTTDAGIRRKAMFIFYKEKKNEDDIISQLKHKLETAGLLKTKDGKDCIHWTLIKECTDEIFNSLSEEDKMIWYKKAC